MAKRCRPSTFARRGQSSVVDCQLFRMRGTNLGYDLAALCSDEDDRVFIPDIKPAPEPAPPAAPLITSALSSSRIDHPDTDSARSAESLDTLLPTSDNAAGRALARIGGAVRRFFKRLLG